MMDNFDMAVALIKEAQEEEIRYESFRRGYENLSVMSEADREKFWSKFKTIPKKSIVNDNIKLARRLLVKEYM
jgi:hypothetical protein